MLILFISLGLLVCLALSFFFSGSETAVISVNRYRLRHLKEEGDPTAGPLLKMLSNTQRLLIMVLIGTNIANVLSALFFRILVQESVASHNRELLGFIRLSELVSLLVLTPLVIVLAEILPKTLFRTHADGLIAHLRAPFKFCIWLMYPLIAVVEQITKLVLPPLAEQRIQAMRRVTRQDLLNLISEEKPEEEAASGTASGVATAESAASSVPADPAPAAESVTVVKVLPRAKRKLEALHDIEENDERRMVENIIYLQETTADAIMTPLAALDAVPLGRMDLVGLRTLAQRTGFSRFPVYRDRIVNLIGAVDIFRVLREDDGTKRLEDFMELPHYVPESKRVDDLLQDFLRLRLKNAVVVDEYGGCIGWISREDIFEEIVGEFEDELDRPADRVAEESEGVFVVQGRTEIDDLNTLVGSDFTDEGWETIAGLVLHEAGRIPAVGERVSIGEGWRATILGMDHLRIDKLRLERPSRKATAGPESESH